ncbi:hypothetical protein [Lutibacter sp.]|uniref:hypothetical protein n=1 Tax=Lutibacter sp. TaxID=1925666 RepID=UPI00273773F3|nr:hypothetical protein [Lutibacter sp.]MDP3311775.1 hypothetical protein [Lutibacter sp.]
MKYLYKIASILAFFIGMMSIIAGSKVLLGIDKKNYTVLNWLVIYNVGFGFISIVTAYLIGSKHQFAKKFILFILASHSILLSYLYFFNENVASESMNAMLFRISIWIIIFLLFTNSKTQSK